MDIENKKILKDSLEIIRKYSNREDADIISSLLRDYDSNELDENTLNQFVHKFYKPTPEANNKNINESKERGAR